MDENTKKTEELLIELAHQEQIKNKKLLTDMYVITSSTIFFYVLIAWLASYTLKSGPLLGTIICVSTVVMLAVCFYSLKIEIEAGYYECKNCHEKFVPKSYFSVLIAPHFNTTRFLKCPHCGKRTWSKKVMSKE